MNRLQTLQKTLFAFIMMAMIGAQASAQTVGGDINLDVDRDGDVNFLGANVDITGRAGGNVQGLAADINIDADIGGNIEIVGADLTIGGTVGGNVEAAGADITLSSDVAGEVSLAGADITILGTISSDLEAAGAVVNIEENARINGDINLAGRDVYVRGSVGGEAEIIGREVFISGRIEGPAELEGLIINIEAGAEIIGPVTVKAENEPNVSPEAIIEGGLTYEYKEFEDDFDFENFKGWHDLDFDFNFGPPMWAIGSVFAFSAFIIGMLFALAAPNTTSKIMSSFRRNPAGALGLGLVVLAVSPVIFLTLFVLLIITVVGIPLAFFLFFAFPLILFLAYAFGGMAIGDLIFNRSDEPLSLGMRTLSFAVALAGLAALSVVPVLGAILGPIVLILGLGAWTIAIFSKSNGGGATVEV